MDDAARASIQQVVAYAQQREHWYIVNRGKASNPPPGDNPNHVIMLNSYRCVFSYTRGDGVLYRHLSISIPSELYPDPVVTFAIAEMFGFTGWDGQSMSLPHEWIAVVSKQEHAVVLAQEVKLYAVPGVA